MTPNKTVYVTTSIPYVNSKPHIGHALELVQADALARYYRSVGKTVIFQTGTDENAFKNVLAAKALGITTQELVDQNADVFRSLVETLNISADTFIRTTEERHKKGVIEFWKRLNSSDLYSKRYSGLYCVGCEDFYLEKDLVNGVCPDHNVPPKQIEEENIFFRLSHYQNQLEELIRTDKLKIVPEKRKNEVLNFIRSGLQDISITRSAERSGHWGVSVPGDSSQVIYVWIDALINYLSGQGFGSDNSWQQVWSPQTKKIHVIGKNVWKFHAVYWPALLLSANLPLPDELFIHGFLTENGRKISKSLGNAIDPFEFAHKYGTDGLRHYLLKAVSPFDDGDFSTERVAAVYTNDLANGLGNLLSRLTSLCEKAGYGQHLANSAHRIPETTRHAFEEFKLDDAAQLIWRRVAELNQDIAQKKPWELLRSGDHVKLKDDLSRWLDGVSEVGALIRPLLPETSQKIETNVSTNPVRTAPPLFPRIE
jgi:methionyl-tRNA synthetase